MEFLYIEWLNSETKNSKCSNYLADIIQIQFESTLVSIRQELVLMYWRKSENDAESNNERVYITWTRKMHHLLLPLNEVSQLTHRYTPRLFVQIFVPHLTCKKTVCSSFHIPFILWIQFSAIHFSFYLYKVQG